MNVPTSLVNLVSNCVGALALGGGSYRIDMVDGTSRLATAAEILIATKATCIYKIRAEAAAIITAKWPLWAQTNCALGIYPEATVTQCATDIAAVITASNTAEDAIEAATTVAEVEAVTATWPTL